MTTKNLLGMLRQAPPDALYPVRWIVSQLEAEPMADDNPEPAREVPATPTPNWQILLWTAPSETKIGTRELCEAVGRPVSWAYRHTSRKSGLPMIPHSKLDGALLFTVGEVRAWIRDHEEVVHSGRMESAASERGGLRAVAGKERAA